MLLQAKFAIVLDTSLWLMAIAAYLVAVALDEIDFRSLLGGIAERRFQRIAMSLGDGLVCADQNGLVTVWNPGRRGDLRLSARGDDRPAARTGLRARRRSGQEAVPLSVAALSSGGLQSPGGKVMELEGRRKNGETFPLEACFSEWQGVDGIQYGAVMRDISVRKREAERIRYLAEYDTLTGLANRNSLSETSARADRDARRPAQGRPAGAEPRQVQADQRFARSHVRRSRALRGRGTAARLCRSSGLVARLSGDEFAIVITGDDAEARARALAERMAGVVRQISRRRRRPPGARQCQHRHRNLSGPLRAPPTNSSATPTSRSIGRRPPAAAGMSSSSARSATSSRRGCRSRRSWDGLPSAKSLSCSISRRSISRTAGLWAPRL